MLLPRSFPRLFTAAFLCLTGLLNIITVQASETLPSLQALEQQGALIGRIVIERQNVFEESDKLASWRRTANRLHVITQESVIRSQLLFAEGQPLKVKAIEESARLLRQNRYLYDAEIKVSRFSEGVADLMVVTRDTWTLSPELDLSTAGGETFYTIGLEDDNLLGTGASINPRGAVSSTILTRSKIFIALATTWLNLNALAARSTFFAAGLAVVKINKCAAG